MASYKTFVISGLLLLVTIIQSAPIENVRKIIHSSSMNNKEAIKQHLLKSDDSEKTSSTTIPTTTVSQNSLSPPEKKKRYIDDDQLDGFLDDDSDEIYDDKTEHVLHTKIHETSANIHDNADRPVDTDDSKVFSDIGMTSSQLTNLVRRRRDVKLIDQLHQRRKRALSPYDFYDTDSFYDPYADLIERHKYTRPIRSFAPIYWYPSAYARTIRSVLEPSFYESPEWPILYSNTIDDDDEIDENPVSINDDENDYETNRYPILLQSSNNPFDNLELQQQYNIDDLPMDEDNEQKFNDDDDNDDDDQDEEDEEKYRLFQQNERPYYTGYGPLETYF